MKPTVVDSTLWCLAPSELANILYSVVIYMLLNFTLSPTPIIFPVLFLSIEEATILVQNCLQQ